MKRAKCLCWIHLKKNWRILKDAAKVKRENNNLLYSLENGMEDEELTALYKDDIIDVESMTVEQTEGIEGAKNAAKHFCLYFEGLTHTKTHNERAETAGELYRVLVGE